MRKYPGEITLIPIGPLTNIAVAVRKAPDIIKKIKRIVLMGGHAGIYTPDALGNGYLTEWNILCDPEAARIVYTCGAEIFQVGLDVTLKCSLSEEDVAELKSKSNKSKKFLSQLMSKWFESTKFSTPVMHDPLALACLNNDFCTFRKQNIFVALEGSDRGKTLIADERTPFSSSIMVAEDVDVKRFIDFFKNKIYQ